MAEARDDGNTILFSAIVLMVLYCATAVGVTFQWVMLGGMERR